jgi:hypothetical protein
VEPLLFIDVPTVTVRPGDHVDAPLRVRNVGDVVEEFQFEALGLPSSFATFEPTSVSLYPSEEGRTKIVFNPRRVVPPVPGPFSFGVRAVSAASGEASAVAEGVVEILPFGDMKASLRSDRSTFRHTSSHHVVLENYGNVGVRVALEATDAGSRLRFDFERDVVEVGAGAVVEVRVRVSSRLMIGGAPETHRCTITVTPIDAIPDADGNPTGLEPIELIARLRQRALIPTWVFPLAVVAALVALVLAFIVVRDDRMAERAVVQTGPPPPPRELTATPASTSSIKLSWNDVGGEDGYILFQQTEGGVSVGGGGAALGWERVRLVSVSRPAQNTGGNTGGGDKTGGGPGECAGCEFVTDLPANTSGYTVKKLSSDVSYCFYLTATYKRQSSSLSKPACAGPEVTLPPCTPTTFIVAPAPGSSSPTLELSWQPGQPEPRRATCSDSPRPSFRIQQELGIGSEIVSRPDAGDTATTIDDLDPATQYCYQIQAVTPVAESDFTDPVCATTAAAATTTTSTTTTTPAPGVGGS